MENDTEGRGGRLKALISEKEDARGGEGKREDEGKKRETIKSQEYTKRNKNRKSKWRYRVKNV